MTLCGWKIFSKGKQKVKQAKADVTCASTTESAARTLQVTSLSASVAVSGVSASNSKGESPSVARAANDDDETSWDDGPWTVEGDEVDGNPRNKCALKPGHSLMDWIRLGSSGLDLSGTKGITTPVSSAELAKHCKQDDAWLAIRGKVYNVTRYMEFHPGGPDELMKGVGKDATKLFDDVHAWVNYEQLLSKCYIGPLRNSAIIDLEPMKPLTKTSSDSSGNFRLPTLPFLQTSSAKTSPIKSASIATKDDSVVATDEIVPRFDWIQKTSDLTLIFYTRALCNPGLVVSYESNNELIMRIQIERTTHVYSAKLSHDVNYPGVIRVSYETGKIELRFVKTKPQLWTNYGVIEKRKLMEMESLQWEFEVVRRQAITHDSYGVELKPVDKVLFFNPIGYHVSVSSIVGDTSVSRSYTPIPLQHCPIDIATPNLAMLIKSYETGILSKHITSSICKTVHISQPKGNFLLASIKDCTKVGLLAAGSGITPILAVLQYLLERTSNRIEKIDLLFFNKTEQDIWCRGILEKIAEKDNRLTIRHILSEPQADWQGETGRVSCELIAPLADTKSPAYVSFCCICGPTPFNDLSEKLLKQNGFAPEHLHFFQG